MLPKDVLEPPSKPAAQTRVDLQGLGLFVQMIFIGAMHKQVLGPLRTGELGQRGAAEATHSQAVVAGFISQPLVLSPHVWHAH